MYENKVIEALISIYGEPNYRYKKYLEYWWQPTMRLTVKDSPKTKEVIIRYRRGEYDTSFYIPYVYIKYAKIPLEDIIKILIDDRRHNES